jgi:hypothetical protein
MSNTEIGQTASSVNARLPEIFGDAIRLQFDAEHLNARAGTLLARLKQLVEDHRAVARGGGEAFDNALDAAFDSVAWAHRACENVAGEFNALVDHLDDAVVESLSSDND